MISEANGWQFRKLGDCRIHMAASLPDIRALYAFMAGDSAHYIGVAAQSLVRRIREHYRYFTAIQRGATHLAFLPVGDMPRLQMIREERRLIDYYKPDLCRCWKSREALKVRRVAYTVESKPLVRREWVKLPPLQKPGSLIPPIVREVMMERTEEDDN